jgi:methionine-rich copper-binding protein CopC
MRARILRIRSVALPLAALMALLFVGVASAHEVEVTNSEPADGAGLGQSPAQVKAWFNEELQTGVSTMVVLDASGEQVDNRDGGVDLNDPDHASMVVSLPLLPDGAYTVSWYGVLLDGDPSEGQFTFFVGVKSASQAVAVSQSSALEAPEVSQAPTGESSGLPIAWITLGLGILVAGTVLMALVLRSRATQRGLRRRRA